MHTYKVKYKNAKPTEYMIMNDILPRLQYGLKCHYKGLICDVTAVNVRNNTCTIRTTGYNPETEYEVYIGLITPYLRSISMMTPAEKEKYLRIAENLLYRDTNLFDMQNIMTDWLNAHMIDIHDLIPAGFALEAHAGLYNTLADYPGEYVVELQYGNDTDRKEQSKYPEE